MTIDFTDLSSRFVLAPMAGFTSWPMRLLIRRYGAGLCVTEMAKARHIVENNHPDETACIIHRHPDEEITGAQLVGSDPEQLARAAEILAKREFDFIDLNAACPVRRIRGEGGGSALMETPEKIGMLIGAIRRCGLPVTIKLRAGSRTDPDLYLRAADAAERAGVSAIFFHARGIHEPYTSHTLPDHDATARLVEACRIPVFAGGGIDDAQTAVAVLQSTRAAGVIIARAAIGNPFIFREAAAMLSKRRPAPPAPSEIISAIRTHAKGLQALLGEHDAMLRMRTLLPYYAARTLRPLPADFSMMSRTLTTADELERLLLKMESILCESDVE